jgi:hemerythrin
LGRLTPSFRQVYTEVMDELRTEIRNALVDPHHKKAFNLLYKEAWYPEEAAMGQSTLPTVLDKLCMVANIHTRKLIEDMRAEIELRALRIQNLQDKISELENRLKVNF